MQMLFACVKRFVSRTTVATLKKSKTLDGPLKKPQETPGQICTNFAEKSNCSWKKSNFSWKKSNFFGKKWLFVEQISDDFFYSSTLIFQFFTFNGPKTEKITTRSILSHQKPLAFFLTHSTL